MPAQRLSSTMNMLKLSRDDVSSSRADRLALWIALVLGLLLMLVSAGKAEQPTATRVDRFNGTLAAGKTLSVENVSGDIVATPGPQFSAVVTLTVTARTAEKANEILKKTKIESSQDDDGWSLETVLPGERPGSRGNRHGLPCDGCRVVARYELVVPPGVQAELQTVNGDVRARDLDGEASLESVNGSIEVRGAKRGLSLQTVNGRIDAAATALPAGADVSLQSVNGNVMLTLPKDARFDFSASTMNGTITSTFPLPPRPAAEAAWTVPPDYGDGKAKGKTPKPAKGKSASRVIIEDEDGNRQEIDLSQLDQELADSMKELEVQIERNTKDVERQAREIEKQQRDIERQVRRIEIPNPQREYSGSIGKGGPEVRMETLNGKVLLLAAGTKEADAKPLVSGRRSFVVTVPDVHVRVAVPPVAPAPPAPPPPGAPRAVPPVPPVPGDGEDVVRGDVAGDFLSTSGGDYRIGKVSGRVQILTHSGEIRVAAAGAGADLKTFGGDVVVGPVSGDLKASTLAGDIIAQSVTGSALADTKGGDIRIERVGGNLDAHTSGGDIRVPRVGGGIRAASAGGEIRLGLVGCDGHGAVSIRNDGGDVTLALPAECKADIELVVTGADEEDNAIRSDFPELAVSRKAGTQRATGTLNGGGEKIQVRTTSGVIRLRKGTLS
jgi:DUF4097 and DUF4098 domain-containing protein YvlB